MNGAILGAATAAIGILVAIADRSGPQASSAETRFPPGCAIALTGGPGLVPRAGLRVENRLGHAIAVSIQARGSLPRIELGTVGPGGRAEYANTLPAGRNVLKGVAAAKSLPPGGDGASVVIYVNNHGADTCRRRYLWRIE